MQYEHTTLNPMEVETLTTNRKLEKSKKLYQFNKNKSFLHAGLTALSLTVGAGAAIILFNNQGDYYFPIMAITSGVAAAVGIGENAFKAAQEAALHEADVASLTEKVNMLREKLKNSGNQITSPILNK